MEHKDRSLEPSIPNRIHMRSLQLYVARMCILLTIAAILSYHLSALMLFYVICILLLVMLVCYSISCE